RATNSGTKNYSIPLGYCLKHWNPTESPIILLGSVFDANSLGRWIYDWTVYTHGPLTSARKLAREMLFFLIKVSGRIKRCKECIRRIRLIDNIGRILKHFVRLGERIIDQFHKLLKMCEGPMLKASQKIGQLGTNSGVAFVNTLFGQERQLTEFRRILKLMRRWNVQFDAKCEDML
ncbi:hypothetical protein F5883DRAFT_368690, partial [Diaporthe sp. PMI_573]